MVALFRFSIWRLDVVVNMRKILNFLKLCLPQKDPYPWGIYETTEIKRIQSKPISIDKTLRFTQSRVFFIIKSLYQNLYIVSSKFR